MLYERSWKFAKPTRLIIGPIRRSIILVHAPSQISATTECRWAMRLPLAISSMGWTWTRHLSSPASKQVVPSPVQVVKRRSIMPTSSFSPSCYFASLSWSVWACKNFDAVRSFLRRWVRTFRRTAFHRSISIFRSVPFWAISRCWLPLLSCLVGIPICTWVLRNWKYRRSSFRHDLMIVDGWFRSLIKILPGPFHWPLFPRSLRPF